MQDNYDVPNEGRVRRYCEDCKVLTEALRDMEQQCREAEDEGCHIAPLASKTNLDVEIENEEIYLLKLQKLQRRRDCALDVLLKHQSLEHSERS